MSKRTVVVVIVASVLAIITVVGLIYGLVTHSEPTFMGTCLSETSRVLSYEVDGADDCSVYHWQDSLPLCVYTERYRDSFADLERHAGLHPVVAHAARRFNKEMGGQFLQPVSADSVRCYSGKYAPPRSLRVVLEVPSESTWHDKAAVVRHHFRDGALFDAVVYVSNTSSDAMLEHVLLHEFGHVFMLAHDDYAASIMFRKMGDPAFVTRHSPLVSPHFSDVDVSALRAAYPHVPSL